ncbi:MAG: methionine--tRNA ligase [Phycisphaerales bacterium]|nr:methionine--tRNA ligase [Phycisphaerales bacterium]
MPSPCYITTPIYYVNDRPHIGHCYTTLLADVAARFERLRRGEPPQGPAPGVFMLTGTDEHADKVVTTGAAHGCTPLEWSDRNAAEFQRAFAFMNFSQDDFIRTTQERHKSKVLEYVAELQRRGDVYLGDYSGWYDESQDEYLTETVAKESPHGPFTSPVTGRPLVRRSEKNYFFRLSAYEGRLRAHIEGHPGFILPEARRNEVLGRLRQGLQDVPISRAITDDPASQWGIRMPSDPGHRIYVWIDALFNYLSAIDSSARGAFWPPRVHVMAKDILWFHAVIWPCMLMALGRDLPGCVYAHSYWVREGKKMSKSLGNFVTLEVLQAYAARYSLDALRWYLLTQGPLGATDADFSHAKFVDVYNADLANGIGNSASRVANMIDKYFGGVLPECNPAGAKARFDARHADLAGRVLGALDRFDLAACAQAGISLVSRVDEVISEERPFTLAKDMPANGARVAEILCFAAESLRIASVLLAPALTSRMEQVWRSWGCAPGRGQTLEVLCAFGGPAGLRPGARLAKGEALFMRADPAEAPPA